jgi:F0F1-type ATP synthase membrane subunit b/b'
LVKITKEIDKADEILQTKKDLKAETEAKLEELNQMKQHFETNFVHV